MRSALFVFVACLVTLVAVAPSAQAPSAVFDSYRKTVEPVFLKSRDLLNGPCFVCHAKITSRLKLQPLQPGATGWTEAQSRRNLEAVMKLITPGNPQQSRLLLQPLASDAGGTPAHPGGKIWKSQEDPEWQALAAWVKSVAPAPAARAGALDFEVFRTRVQPVFLDKKDGHARCYVCHSQGTGFRLQALSADAAAWNDEQSRKNFEAVQRLVVPGDPASSRLLMMPLATEAGGDPFHPGGKRWRSQQDPEWQALAAWVRDAAPEPQKNR
jgi:hypothetical protein